MKVKVKGIAEVEVEIDYKQAFLTLCDTLDMKWAIDEESEFFIEEEYGEKIVYKMSNNTSIRYDERGDLFIALRNLAKEIFPNVSFR